MGMLLTAAPLFFLPPPPEAAATALLPRPLPRLIHVVPVQGHARPTITADRVVLATPDAETPLAVRVGPPEQLPRSSFVRIRGLPPTVALSDGHAIAPGAWAVPIAALASLKVIVPAGASGRSEVAVVLVTVDGVVLAETSLQLVVTRAAALARPDTGAAPERSGPPPTIATIAPAAPRPPPPAAQAPAAPASLPPPTPKGSALKDEALARAERYLIRGNEKLAEGDLATAQLFFERAAEAGLGEGALALGGTHDAVELARLGLADRTPNRDEARRWYERARDLGVAAAEDRLRRLGVR